MLVHRTFVCDCLRASFYVFFLFKIKNFPLLLPFPEKVQLNCSAILQPAKPVSQSEWPICLCLLEACSATSDSNLRPVKKQQRECTHKRSDCLTSCDQHLAALSRADFNRKKTVACTGALFFCLVLLYNVLTMLSISSIRQRRPPFFSKDTSYLRKYKFFNGLTLKPQTLKMPSG